MSLKLTSSKDKALGFVHALVHGDSGIGKTTSLGVLPEKSTLIISCERGLLPLRNMEYQVVMVETWEDIRILVNKLQHFDVAEDGSMSGEIAEGVTVSNIRIIAWDSLSEIYRLCLQWIVDVDRKALWTTRTSDKKKYEKVEDHPTSIYEDLLAQEDFGVLYKRMILFLATVNHLPCHIIFTAITGWRHDKQTGMDLRVPQLHRSLESSVPGFFDLVMHMESFTDNDGKNTRMFRTENDGVHMCKDASRSLLAMEPADWNVIFGKILGKKEKRNANAK